MGGGGGTEAHQGFGSVGLRQSTSTQYFSTAAARFSTLGATESPSANCVSTTVPSCTVLECDLTADAGAAAADTGPPRSAGDVSFSGGAIPSAGIVLQAHADGSYPSTNFGQAFTGGDALTVRAAGKPAGVPAFSHTIQAPADIVIPAFGNTVVIDRSNRFTLNWTGALNGSVYVQVASLKPNERRVDIACVFPAAPGTGTIPVSAIGKLLTTGGIIAATPSNSGTFMAGEYQITFTAYGTQLGQNATVL